MAEGDPSAQAGNKPPIADLDLRFSKASDGLHSQARVVIANNVEFASRHLSEALMPREKVLVQDGWFKVTECDQVATNPRTHILGAPAQVRYSSRWLETVNGAEDAGYNRTEVLHKHLTVAFNPGTDEEKVCSFDFTAKDPVEELARLAQGMSDVNGAPLGLDRGVSRATQIMDEAVQAIRQFPAPIAA